MGVEMSCSVFTAKRHSNHAEDARLQLTVVTVVVLCRCTKEMAKVISRLRDEAARLDEALKDSHRRIGELKRRLKA